MVEARRSLAVSVMLVWAVCGTDALSARVGFAKHWQTSNFGHACNRFSRSHQHPTIRTAQLCVRKLRPSMASSAAQNPAAAPTELPVAPIYVVSGICNTLLYRIQLVPMRDYTYFISQFSSLCYVIFYGNVLRHRSNAGIVTSKMIEIAKRNWFVFAGIGFLEAAGFAIGLYSAARIPGSLLGVLGQMFLLWNVIFSRLLLGRRFDGRQLLGLLCVIAGVLTCTLPQATAAGLGLASERAVHDLWHSIALYCMATPFVSLSIIIKEWAFRTFDLDIFVVSTFGSAAQCLFTLALLPVVLTVATPIPAAEFLGQGWRAFTGATHGCMPWLSMAYITANLATNIACITLVKRGGAVKTSILGAAMIPLGGLAFCLDLPLLGPAPFRWTFVAGLAVVTCGSLLYNHKALAAPAPAAPATTAAEDAQRICEC